MKHFFRDFKSGVGDFGYNLSFLVNVILLSLVYITGVGVTSVIARISGKKFYETKISKDAKTYWSDLNLKKQPIENYYKQF